MCGGCGRTVARDAWSPVLSTSRARWQAARSLDAFLREVGHPARVTSTGAAWVVASGTGRSVVAGSATELWAAVRAVRPVAPAQLRRLAERATTPEAAALARAAGS